VHVRLFQLYTTSSPCHRNAHVEYVQDISCWFKQWDEAITSTIYGAVASSKVINGWFIHSQRHLRRHSCATISQLTTSWCWILRTVGTNALVDHGGFPLLVEIDWSRSPHRKPATWYAVHWQPMTPVWIYSHETAYFILFVLLPVLWTIFKCASWVIFSVAALAASRKTTWCLRSCWLPIRDIFYEAPDSHPLRPGLGGCVSMICWCGIGEEDDINKKCHVLRII